MILGIDAGNYETKVCFGNMVDSFVSDIGEYRERKLRDSFGKDDMVWEYKGEKGFAGTLARFESEFGGTIKGKTKANSDAILRALIAVHKYGDKVNRVVIGQPIDTHDEDEKNKIKSLLKGKHTFKLNGVSKDIIIEDVEVAPEGASAILSNPKDGLIRVIDIGSGTTNFATLFHLRRVDKDSFTEKLGTEVTKNKDPKEMAKKIHRIISGTWDVNDKIFLTGGGATKVYKHLSSILTDCHILSPRIGNNLINTKYANAVGFYTIAKGLYENV